MDFIVVGAGAVGMVAGGLLEAAGHRVHYFVRPSQRARFARFGLRGVDGARVQTPEPSVSCAGEPAPRSDWVLVCVRGEQLDDALRDVAAHLGQRRIAIAAVTLEPAVTRARACGLAADTLAFHVAFGAWRDAADANLLHWFPFSVPSTISTEAQPHLRGPARELAEALARAGLPTRSARSMHTSMRLMVALNCVLLLGWDLGGWDLARMLRDRQLRSATAAAMHETARYLALESGALRPLLRLLPATAYVLVLRAVALLMGANGREVWRHHGPKIRAQTRYVVGDLLARGHAAGDSMAALRSLWERWQRALPPHAGGPASATPGAER